MLQERLNYLMLLHVHRDENDKLCLKAAINDCWRLTPPMKYFWNIQDL